MTFAYDNVLNQILIKKITFYTGTRKARGVFVVLLHLFTYHYVIYDDLYLHMYHRYVFLMALISVPLHELDNCLLFLAVAYCLIIFKL